MNGKQLRKPKPLPHYSLHQLYDELDEIYEIYDNLYGNPGYNAKKFKRQKWSSGSYTHTYCKECGYFYGSDQHNLWVTCWQAEHKPVRLIERNPEA